MVLIRHEYGDVVPWAFLFVYASVTVGGRMQMGLF